MTKKDYIVLANGVKRALLNSKQAERAGIIFCADCLAVELKKDNAKFQAVKFWDYINKK